MISLNVTNITLLTVCLVYYFYFQNKKKIQNATPWRRIVRCDCGAIMKFSLGRRRNSKIVRKYKRARMFRSSRLAPEKKTKKKHKKHKKGESLIIFFGLTNKKKKKRPKMYTDARLCPFFSHQPCSEHSVIIVIIIQLAVENLN